MIERIKEIILDYQNMPFECWVPRDLSLTVLKGKATVCIGARRCGKSTLMFQQMKKLIDDGIPRECLMYLNFFDDRLYGLTVDKLNLVVDAYYQLYPKHRYEETVYFFFDEIQMVGNWEIFVTRILATENCRVFITGSSAQMLSSEIATQMRGRSLSYEVFPFSFTEFLKALQINFQLPISSNKRNYIQDGFEKYWNRGGFPEVFDTTDALRRQIHQEYFNAMIYRDIVERHNVSNPLSVKITAHWLINNIGGLYSVNNLSGALKALGCNISRETITNYLSWFEDSYLFFSLKLFDANIKRSNMNPKKIYCIDHAMAISCGNGILVNSGHLLENLVYLALRRTYRNIYYYRTKHDFEIDFIVSDEAATAKKLYQVAESLQSPNTAAREITALKEAMAETGLSEGYIITRYEQEELTVDNGIIHIIPAWKFLMVTSKNCFG